jgi:lysozyme family protein|tara:strand:+ start:355 stop:693 length:339 start_codon:yes stop_codon:yes gene_type:complete
MGKKKEKQFFMHLLIKALSRVSKRELVKEKNKTYIVNMDKQTEKRVQKIISQTRCFVQEQVDQGANLVEVAQVMLAMSREAIVDAYGEALADSYIHSQISQLQSEENNPTVH